MKKIFWLNLLFTILVSCDQKERPHLKVVERITPGGPFDYSTIEFMDGSFAYRAPGWIRDTGLQRGDTIPTLLTQDAWPDTLVLQCVYRDDILDSDTKELLGIVLAYEDNTGLIIRRRNYKKLKQAPSEIKLCKSELNYYECGTN